MQGVHCKGGMHGDMQGMQVDQLFVIIIHFYINIHICQLYTAVLMAKTVKR